MKLITPPEDELFQLEQKIARRADELSCRNGSAPSHALECWLQAEREVWGPIVDRPAMVDSAKFKAGTPTRRD